MTYLLSTLFENVQGVDPSQVMIDAARDDALVASTLGIVTPASHSVKFHVAPGESSGLPSGQFDLVSAATSSHWFPWRQGSPPGKTVWQEMSRLLKPGGSLVFMQYASVNIVAHPHIQEQMSHFMSKDGGWAKYLEHADELSATTIGTNYFKTMPKPTEPEFDTSQTVLLRLNASVAVGKDLEPEDIAPLPEWVTQNTSTKTTDQPVVFNKLPYKQLGFFLRSTSAWPKYLADHPEEKALEAECKDLPFRMLDQWRREEAERTGGKMLEWDEVVDVSQSRRWCVCNATWLTVLLPARFRSSRRLPRSSLPGRGRDARRRGGGARFNL